MRWSDAQLARPLAAVRHRQGRLIGHMEALDFPLGAEAVLHALTGDVVKSSEIEGEVLDREQVRSSIARRLGMDIGGLVEADRDVEGVVEMMLDTAQNHAEPPNGNVSDSKAAPVLLGRASHTHSRQVGKQSVQRPCARQAAVRRS